jgi:hypothetical protein
MSAQRRCAHCKDRHEPADMIQVGLRLVCGQECRAAVNLKTFEQSIKVKRVEFNRETKRRKETIITIPKHKARAEGVCHKFIHLRDRKEVCCSCDRTTADLIEANEWGVGGLWDAGHFISKGAVDSLRFDERNIARQCKSCNGGSGKYARKTHTVSQEYEQRKRAKDGNELVDWLMGYHEPHKWTHVELYAIEESYRLKYKELKVHVDMEQE